MNTLIRTIVLGVLAGGCAWVDRDNRPVWNAFEEHLVPNDDAAFVATLPLTVPGGIVAILLDTFVAHPVQVTDDAWRDAAELWTDQDWQDRYYTELAALPLRAAGTPVVFVGAWLGRSLFAFAPHHGEAERAALADRRERDLIEWFESLADGPSRAYHEPAPGRWSAALDRAFGHAREQAGPLGRYELYRYAQSRRLAPWSANPEMGLRDPDPVVRFRLLERWPADEPISEPTRRALRSDPNEAVRELATAITPP